MAKGKALPAADESASAKPQTPAPDTPAKALPARKTKRNATPRKPAASRTAPSSAKPVAGRATRKPVAPAAATKPARTAAKATVAKVKKEKTVRDSFNMPEADYALIAALKKRALKGSREVKKSELLRIGLRLLNALGDAQFHKEILKLPRVKAGRPKK